MKGYEIKFKFENELIDKIQLDDIFQVIGNSLDMRFDSSDNRYSKICDEIYRFQDVTNQTPEAIEGIENSFFDFSFAQTVDVCFYRFLVLKNNDKLTILAIIHSSIFNYGCITDFINLFSDLNNGFSNNKVLKFHDDADSYLKSLDFKDDEDYWKNHLFDANQYVKFYNIQSSNYNHINLSLNNKKLSTFLKEKHISKFNFIASIFSLYLSRIDRTMGCLLKTGICDGGFFKKALLKIGYDGEKLFDDYLNEITNQSEIAAEHVRVDIDNYLTEDKSFYSINDFSNLKDVSIVNGKGNALTVNVYDDHLDLIYNEGLFSDVYMEHLVENIDSIISNVLDDSKQQCKDIDILSDAEKQLLFKFNKGKSVDVDLDETLSMAFRKNSLKYPDMIAIDDGVNQITYAELEYSSNSVAYDLSNNYDLDLGDRVGLMLPRDYHFPELVLALNKMGIAFIPIDTDYPLKRIQHMLNIGEAKSIITTRKLADINDFDVDVICIEDLKYDLDVEFDIIGSSEDVFSIMFTSGTTGLPKGVMISNRVLTGVGVGMKEICNSSPGDVTGCYNSFSFGASFRIYIALHYGETCRIYNDEERNDSLMFIEALKNQPLNDLLLPPGLGLSILENEPDIDLRYMMFTGAKLESLPESDNGMQLVNFFGTTETSYAIAGVLDIDKDDIPVGKPIANTWAYILDENKNPVPVGVPGYLHISRNFLTDGYYNRPDLTDKVFIDNPNSDCEDNREMYYTGDLAFYNFDGEIQIIGRNDDQLSVRGFRIESEEILRIMNGFESIREICLDVDKDTLTAYYTASGNVEIDEVKDALKSELPPYMIPSLFLQLDEIPLNANGKIDKSALKRTSQNNEDVEITDEVLQSVVDAFKKILKTDDVLIDDGFVALGGNSLSAMQLQLILKEKLDVSLSSNELIELSTPLNISNHIKLNSNTLGVYENELTFEEECPLSESQLNIYLDELVNEMGTGYNNSFKIEFKKYHSVDEIRIALTRLIEVYPILKARIISADEELPKCVFDGEVEIVQGSADDVESFVRPFKLDKNLSRFMIVEDDENTGLCFDIHHLIFDGSSLNILLNTLYSILDNDEVDHVDDGILRQISFENNLSKKYFDDAGSFFEAMLGDREEVYELMPFGDDKNGSEFIDAFEIDSGAMDSFLKDNSVTYNQLFASVFAYALSRYTGSSKVLFNILVDGRGHMDLSESVGMFVKTLPVLMDCANQDVPAFLSYSSNLINSVMKYDLYPFHVLANEYELNTNVFFQYSHDIFKNDVSELKHDIQRDFSFFIFNRDDGEFGIRILHSDKFSEEFVSRFVESYKLILNEMLNTDFLGDINFTTQSDLKLLDSYNQTENALIYDDILDAFNDNLSKYPDNPLVHYKDNSYSYSESAFIADLIAKSLSELGIKKQDPVAFLVERSELYVFNILGILSLGAVYVPLDDAHPDDRIQFILNDTEAKVVIASDETYGRVAGLCDNQIILNISDIVNENGNLPNFPSVRGDLACILYTSGTTGVPKGVRITRKSVNNFSQFYVKKYGLSCDDVFALFASIGFDVSMEAIFSSIHAGACINIIPDDVKLNMIAMNSHFIRYGVTYAHLPAQVTKLFIAQNDDIQLKLLCTGGEKLGEIDIDYDYRFVDTYGPTETFIDVTSVDVNSKVDVSSIGHLFDNIRAYVLDDEFRRLPVGSVGELYLAGYQVANGYLNRPEETDAAFLDNPFEDNEDYGIMYRTGDLVRFLPDGSLGIVGRRDRQVKVRGNRLELTEVESTIRSIDIVEDVTVQTFKNGANNELVAYVVVCEKTDDLEKYISDYIDERKPEYMIPSFIIELDEIPLNVNGKVDKRALPDVDVGSLKKEYVAPTNETEKIIVEAFENVFEQENIGIHDDFIRMGGDSITVIRVISMLQKNNVHLTARDILNYKTPYHIAQHSGDVEEVEYDAVEGVVEMHPVQKYFFDQIKEDDYSQQYVLKSYRKLDSGILKKAFDELTNLHDMLRAVYRFENGSPIQEILPVNTQITQINEITVEDNLSQNLEAISDKSRESLDISNKLMDVNLIHHGGDSYLLIVMHHLIVDGVSWNILINDLTNIYLNLEKGNDIKLKRPYLYSDWVNDVMSLSENMPEVEKKEWIDINNSLDEFDIKGPANIFEFNIDAEYDVNNLLMLSEEEYWVLALSRAFKNTFDKDFIFNNESHGRDDSIANLNRAVGWFTSIYPIQIDINSEKDTISLVKDVYNVKRALKNVKHLGLNYSSLIYNFNEFEYRHCPVKFNFLSTEFIFKNELFESLERDLSSDEVKVEEAGGECYGITFNVFRESKSYFIEGNYADETYISKNFDKFIRNLKNELNMISRFNFEDETIVCCLSEPQLGVYLDEKINDKDTAYSALITYECGSDYSVDEVKEAICALIDRHPILKGHIIETGDLPLMICDSYPLIEIIDKKDDGDYSEYVKPFDLDESLIRFYIAEKEDGIDIIYDMHHIIGDATTKSIINGELEKALNGKLDNEVDYGFLYASRDAFEAEFSLAYESAKNFYNEKFADIDEVQNMEIDVDASSGSVILPIRGVRDAVESFAHKNSITVSNFLNSVFAYSYSRFTGDNKVYYTFIENGRHEDYSRNAVSMFARTIPILVDCSNDSIKNYLIHTSDLILESMSNSIYPFRLIASEFDLKNDVNFEYNYDLNEMSDIGDELILSDETDYVSELSCVVYDLDDGYVVNVSYFDKFGQDTIVRFVNVFKKVLIQFLEKKNLADIDYISDDDLMLLDSYNRTERPLKHEDILDAFNENLSRFPDNDLVYYNDVKYTYGEGAYVSRIISDKLKELGVNSSDNVAFLVERSEAYVFCVLGILSTGAAYVPLDDAHPDSRIQFILEDTDAKVLIVSDETYERAQDLTDDCILLNISDILTQENGTIDSLPYEKGNLNCILYTSGTTGTPKGVKITRKSILNLSEFYIRNYDMTRDDVYALFASIGFDVAMKAIFPSICAGAPLAIIPSDIKLDMKSMNEYFAKFNVTHTEISTQVAKLFISQVEDTSLKVLTTGGEKLGESEIDVDYRFADSYGPSEACVDVTCIEVDEKIDFSSIGFLLDNIKAYVLDDEFRRVPVGAVGELYLAGNQIADGYLNREDETVKRFLENPFDDGDYDVMYRTGDIVRLLPDGSLGYIDRRDNQVKIRGNRVELPEVEAVIREIDYVGDVTVQTIRNGTNIELVAYVVVSNDEDGDSLKDSVCDHVGDHKPDYMIPSFVMRLEEIPLNVNGKVDKRQLPEIDVNALHVEYVAPVTEKQKIIVEIFETIFNQEKVSLFDDFVRLGGDSITAIRVISLLHENGISCTAREILNYKTPYLIAQHVSDDVEMVSYDAVEGEVDLLPIQKYFFDQVNLDSYVQLFVLKANRDLDLNLLQRSFDELSNLHDMLRASYRFDEDGNPVQEILPVNTRICNIKEHYITDDFNDNVSRIIGESAGSINLKDNLVEVNLIHYNGESYLSLVLHHLIIDGVSWNILLVDLSYIYFKLGSEDEIDISRPYPYKNWVSDVDELADNISDEEKQHWIEINASLDDSDIKGNTNLFAFNVDANYDVDNLLMLSEEETLALSIARAYKKTYGRDIIFNRESYGRDESLADLSRTIGWFTSEYPVKVDVTNGYDNISLMRDVYALKAAFKEVKNLGLNYSSLIFSLDEMEFKHCPVTFNFLSSEFVFRNELFESINHYLAENDLIDSEREGSESYGITFNVTHNEGYYLFSGDYAKETYIGNQFSEFVENIKSELDFINSYSFEGEGIVCCLSEPQLGIYLDEKVHDKGIAYNSHGTLECSSYSIKEIEDAIHALIDRHPILKGRILDTDEMPLLICDGYPLIETVDVDEHSDLIEPFDLEECLARFFIVDNDDGRFVFYDMHHIISDATCDGIINDEFYRALKTNLKDDEDYGFVRASKETFESRFGKEYDSAIEFFNKKFSDIDDVQYLVGDVDGCEGTVRLPIKGIKSRVESFAYDMGITVSNFLNSVFAYSYSRFTGGDKVYYNFTEHGRHEEYSLDALGMFVRTIPIVVDCKNRSVTDYVGETSDLILESMSNSIYPFRLLASDYDLTNDVIFEYNFDLNDVSDMGDDIIFTDYANSVSEFFCVVNDIDDGYLVSVGHSDKFSQDTALRFVNVFKEVLKQFLDKDELKDIEYCSSDDIKLLDEINNTAHELEYEDIIDAFNDNLSKYKNNILVKFKDRSYTFAEGAFIASKLAESLKELGVDKQDRVAFLTERCEHYILSILGILSSGAVYVPLDNAHPDDRLQFILDDTDAKVVIVSDETANRAETLVDDAVILNISDVLKGDIGSADCLPADYGNLACILYTSGTTGIPKGVKITRKSLLNVSAFYTDNYDLNESDVYGLFSAIGFDVSNFVIGAILYSGACLSVIPEEIRLDMAEMNNYFISHGVSHTFITTQVGKLFMESVGETSLDILLVAGEKLGHVESPDGYDLVDAYGPTEAFAFMSSINNADKIHESSVGLLNYNTKIYVLDDELRCVPRGAVGELYIAGYQLAEGYLNREEETRNAFIHNPFDDGDYDMLYRTGDMVRILSDGTIGVVGRRDSQVKVRGNRLELSEVESTIRQIGHIMDVTVQTISKNGNNELVAYVVSSQNDDVKDSVCRYVSGCKPDYMVPSFVVELDEIPLNVNGKVDKRKLPEVTAESKDYEPPRTSLEQSVANAFLEVLDIDHPVSRSDEFSLLGGDSIAVIKLITRLRQSNIQISVKDVLENQSVAKIAESAEYKISSDKISQESFEGFVEPTPTVDYFNELKLKDPSCFNRSVLLETSKRIDEDILEKAMWAVVNHHDMLRAKVQDNALLVRPKNDEKIFTIEKCSQVKFADECSRINDEIDIFNGPLIKLAIFDGKDCDSLYICIHHLIVDSDSIRIIVNDLNLAYAQISKERQIDLYNKTSSYQDYALAINKCKTDEEILKQKVYWENTLAKLKQVNRTQTEYDVRKWDSVSLKLSKQLSSSLFTHALKHYGCSSRALFLSMILKSWREVIGENALSVSLDNGRVNFDKNILIDRTVGWLNAPYPLILEFKGNNDCEIIENTEKTLANVPHNGFYYPVLMGIESDEIPLLRFNYLGEFNRSNPGKMFNTKYMSDLPYLNSGINGFGHDVNVNVCTMDNETIVKFEFNCERFDGHVIEKLSNSFISNMTEAVESVPADYSDDVKVFSNHPDKKKLFFIHTINFGSEYFYDMAQRLKDDYSVIVIEPYNINHKQNQIATIEDYATKYVEIVKSIQPEGPYYLGGYCFSGDIAHDMAIQLTNQNERVDKLILFDAYNVEDDELIESIVENQIVYAREFLKDGVLNPVHENMEDMISYVLASTSAMYNFKPGYYDGDVIYFKSTLLSDEVTTDASDKLDNYLFSKLAGGYEDCLNNEKLIIREVPVEHDHLINVEALKIVIPELKRFLEDGD